MKKIISVPNHHFVGDGKGGWIKRPGRLKMRLHMDSIDPNDSYVEEIIRNEGLNDYKKKKIKERMLAFLHSYSELNNFLLSQQSDIPVKLSSTELQSFWHSYLINSREFIDEVGKSIHICFGLKENVSGINDKKLNSLLKNIEKAQKYKKEDLGELEDSILKFRDILIFHIELRNQNKDQKNTLIEPPWINPNGKPSEGIIFNKKQNKRVDFIEYLERSYLQIKKFSELILK